MRLRKSLFIKTDTGREGIVTELGYKNGERVVSVEPTDGGVPFWCYKRYIVFTAKNK